MNRHKVGYRFQPETLAALAALAQLHPGQTKTALVEDAIKAALERARQARRGYGLGSPM